MMRLRKLVIEELPDHQQYKSSTSLSLVLKVIASFFSFAAGLSFLHAVAFQPHNLRSEIVENDGATGDRTEAGIAWIFLVCMIISTVGSAILVRVRSKNRHAANYARVDLLLTILLLLTCLVGYAALAYYKNHSKWHCEFSDKDSRVCLFIVIALLLSAFVCASYGLCAAIILWGILL